MNTAVLLRKIGGRLHACLRNGNSLFGLAPAASRAAGPSMLTAVGVLFAVLLVPMLALAALAFTLSGDHATGLLIAPAALVLPGEMKKKQDELGKILDELEKGQKEIAEGKVDAKRGKELDELAEQAESLQSEVKRYQRVAGLAASSRTVDDPILPGGGEQKGQPSEVVGYATLGEAFVSSAEFKSFQEGGYPASAIVNAPLPGGFSRKNGHIIVPVTRGMIESKAVTVGAGVLRADRDTSEVVRFAERDRLTIRDILNVSQTGAPSVEYTTISSVTRAAAPVAEGAVKPEASLAFGTATAPVRTIAVYTPATEQQLQDVPDLQNTIDVELTFDLQKKEEEQIMWGDGTGQNLLGIFNTPGVVAGRTVNGDTLIDKVQRMITDVSIAGLEPNALIIDPLDWETIVLTKATTNEYVWLVVTDGQGNRRILGLTAIPTIAAREPGTFTTNERRMLVGDFRRGAKLWDRQQKAVEIGFINDQFIRNQRTIRVEERVAFGVRRPAAFKYSVTAAHAA